MIFSVNSALQKDSFKVLNTRPSLYHWKARECVCINNMCVNIIHSKAVYTSAAYFSIDAFSKKNIFLYKTYIFYTQRKYQILHRCVLS